VGKIIIAGGGGCGKGEKASYSAEKRTEDQVVERKAAPEAGWKEELKQKLFRREEETRRLAAG